MSSDWDRFFIGMAAYVSQKSKDPSTKCGAVIVRPDKTVCSVGFNGFPKGCDDHPALYENREVKYSRVVHAEANAILFAREPVDRYTMYTYPPALSPTCDRCATLVIQSGIKRVVHMLDETSDFAGRWGEASKSALQMYEEAGVYIESITYSPEDSSTICLTI